MFKSNIFTLKSVIENECIMVCFNVCKKQTKKNVLFIFTV